LHARVPGHQDGAHLLPPRVADDGAAADEHPARPTVGSGHGADEALVLGTERELLAVATPPQDVLTLVAVGVAGDHAGGVDPGGGEPGGAPGARGTCLAAPPAPAVVPPLGGGVVAGTHDGGVDPGGGEPGGAQVVAGLV